MTPGINTLLLSTGALGSFTCSGMTLPIYMGPTALRGIRATGDTLSNVESQVFTTYKFGSTAGDRTPDLLTTRPTCYHSATALYILLGRGRFIMYTNCNYLILLSITEKIMSITKGVYIPGGVQVFGKFKSLKGCMKACGATPNCFGGDYNPWLGKCYFHSNISICDNMQSHQKITHFKKIPCSE